MQIHPHPGVDDSRGGAAGGAASHIASVVQQARAAFESGCTRPYAFRKAQLEGLLRMLEEQEPALSESLQRDVGKPAHEAWASEINFCKASLKDSLKHLKGWMKPESVRTPLVAQPGSSQVLREPLGVVLIIGAWNFPLMLTLEPLIGALSAGNAVVLKPSEVAPETSQLLARLLPTYVDAACVRVVEGAVAETTELLAQKFDHIFFTGNATVGRIVMQAAAREITPVTLELGGKSPCIVDESADIEVAARRIAWGKFYNAGQACVAPDYVLVHERVEQRLLEALVRTVREFYGADPQKSPDFGRIVNARHHARLMSLLPGSGRVLTGGVGDAADRFYLAPTILTEVPDAAPIMEGEIFGPILPVIPVQSFESAMRFVNARPKPLALYLFTEDEESYEACLAQTSAGGVTVNHCTLHTVNPGLPFGGVGESGMGAYHGKASFETFSHRKSVLKKSTRIDPSLQYPPYTASKQAWTRRLI